MVQMRRAHGLLDTIETINCRGLKTFCHRGLTIRAYADDVFLNGPPAVAIEAYAMLKERMAALGLQVATSDKGTKTRAWSPAWEVGGAAAAAAQPALPAEIFRCSGGTKVLGAFIDTDAFVSSAVAAVVESMADDGFAKAYDE